MFESDYERTKDYLRTKLPDYLTALGINPDTEFTCLNPEHHDPIGTMRYNPQNCTVHCPVCGATYDIFALVGLKYGISDVRAQFAKVQELLFAGRTPQTAAPAAQPQPTMGAATFGKRSGSEYEAPMRSFDARTPTFSPLFTMQPRRSDAGDPIPTDSQLQQIGEISQVQNPAFRSNQEMPAAPAARPAQMHPSGAVFGMSANSYRAGPTGSSYLNPAGDRAALSDYSEMQYNYADYLRKAAEQVSKTSFFQDLGLSEEVISRFHLGFDESYAAGTDRLTGEQLTWRAALIPFSDYGYTALNTDPRASEQERHCGSTGIFNEKALARSGSVFICMSELDALSLETLGKNAAALVHPVSVRALLEQISRIQPADQIFYICTGANADGDAVKTLSAGLYNLGLTFKKIKLSGAYPSINAALRADKSALSYKVNKLEELLSISFSPVPRVKEECAFITDAAALSKLQLSPYLYALCARPSVRRRVLNLIMQERLCTLITATTPAAWQFICQDLDLGAAAGSPLNFEPYPNAKALLIDSTEVKTICEKIRFAMQALLLQPDLNFALCADVSALTSKEQAPALIAGLEQLSAQLSCGMLLLCPEDLAPLCEERCLQTLSAAQSADGSELTFTSSSLNGRPLNFTRYAAF